MARREKLALTLTDITSETFVKDDDRDRVVYCSKKKEETEVSRE